MTRETATPPRRYDVDWLRVLAMLAVFVFHCARYFDRQDWHVKNPTLSEGMSYLVGFLSFWIMPLFFVLSSISATFSLKKRSWGQFLIARSRRLLIPLATGMLTHVALQVYVERVTHGQFRGSFFAFYPEYFKGLYGFGGNFAWMGLHLWFLEVLFVLSAITLPLFLWLKRGFPETLARFLARPGAVYLLALPVVLGEILGGLDPGGVGRRDFGGWNLLSYLFFVIVGLIIAGDRRISLSIEKLRWPSLLLGVVLLSVEFHFYRTGRPLGGIAAHFIRPAIAWFWMTAILGLGYRFLRFSNRFLSYANEAVLPFYVLHQTVIVVFGFFLLGWPAGVPLKFLVLTALSLLTTVSLYALLVRRCNVLRFLFGMRPMNRNGR
jgi:peptidoglycan/LPS O-acetylase OafA/YrhL